MTAEFERSAELSRRGAARLAVGLVIASIPAIAMPGAISDAVSLAPVADGQLVTGAPLLLVYGQAPLVALSACLLFMSPGLLLAPILRGARTMSQWVLTALAINLVLVSVVAAVVQAILARPLEGRPFGLTILGLAAACGAILTIRAWRRPLAWFPHHSLVDRATLASLILAPAIVLLANLPRFLWETFNADSVHHFEASRMLLTHALPFLPPDSGMEEYPGVKNLLCVYPSSWFLRLLGPLEISLRLPFLIGLAATYAGLLGLIEIQRQQATRGGVRVLLWAALLLWSLVMAFGGSRNIADLASPAAQDAVFMALFCGFLLSFIARRGLGVATFLGLAYFTSPHALPLTAIWLVSAALVLRPLSVRAMVITVATLIGAVLLESAAPRLAILAGAYPPGMEHHTQRLLAMLRSIQLISPKRIAWIVAPTGFLPWIAVLAWRWHDPVARCVALTAVAVAGVYYFMADTSLHYFIPAMILPLVVLWRLRGLEDPRIRRLAMAAAAALIAVAGAIAWPASFRPKTLHRLVGSTIEVRLPGYAEGEGAAFRRTRLLVHLFPNVSDWRVPDQVYGASPTTLDYYARHRPVTASPPNYVLQLQDDPAPAGMTLIAREDGAAVYVRDRALWAAHRVLKSDHPGSNRLFANQSWDSDPDFILPGGPPKPPRPATP